MKNYAHLEEKNEQLCPRRRKEMKNYSHVEEIK